MGTPSEADDTHLTYDADGWTELLGSAHGLDSRRVKADLERFEEYIGSRQVETGAWRGESDRAR